MNMPVVLESVLALGFRASSFVPEIVEKRIISPIIAHFLKRLTDELLEAGYERQPVALKISDIEWQRVFALDERGRLQVDRTQQAAATIEAPLASFMALALGQEDTDTLFFQRKLKLSGDTELSLLIKNTLESREFTEWLPLPLQSAAEHIMSGLKRT